MLHLPPLYPITDARLDLPLSAQVRRLGAAGFPLVQFRGKPLDARTQWRELTLALEASGDNGGWPAICVNDRADLAVLAAFSGRVPWGVHLGQTDLPAGRPGGCRGWAGSTWGAPPAGSRNGTGRTRPGTTPAWARSGPPGPSPATPSHWGRKA